MKKISLATILVIIALQSFACGPWHRVEYAWSSPYGHFYTTLAEPCSLPEAHDNLMRKLMDSRDSAERSDSTYQALVALYENAVAHLKDPWYFPAHKGMAGAGGCGLAELRLLCAQKRASGNMHIAWLEAKCLHQMGAWDDCVMLCDTLLSQRLTRYMRARIECWQAGAIMHSDRFDDRKEAASLVFAKYGDVRSANIEFIAKNGGPVEMLDFAYFVKLINDDFARTELPYPFSNLEECAFEDTSAGGVDAYRKAIREEWAPRLDFCELMASRNPAHVASWYYTAALVAYVCDMSARAERLLAKAQRCPQTPEEVLPIRCLAMKMYMKKHGLSNARKEKEFWEIYSMLPRQVAYAQFHKEVLYFVMPRFAQTGNHEKLLRFAACFDNPNGTDPWLLDCIVYHSVPMEAAARFADKSPYRGRIYEMLGTRCLRNMDYSKACEYLSRVPLDQLATEMYYQGDLQSDAEYYFCRDPFDFDYLCKQPGKVVEERIAPSRPRLRFAQEMARLEGEIKNQRDPNLRAESMARYATGMINSFYRCWILTSRMYSSGFKNSFDTTDYQGLGYKDSYRHYNPYATDGKYDNVDSFLDWQKETLAEMQRRSSYYMNKSLSTFTDPERAAKLLYALGEFKTITKKYQSTSTARFVKAHCDKYRDYFPMKRS